MELEEALSSAESATKNNVHVEFYSTDSSHFYVCHPSSVPPYIPDGVTAEFFGMEDSDNICHSRSRGSGSSSTEAEMIFDF